MTKSKIIVALVSALLLSPAAAGDWRDDHRHDRGNHYGQRKHYHPEYRYRADDRDRYDREWREYHRPLPRHELWRRNHIPPATAGIYITPYGASIIVPSIVIPVR